MILPKVSGFVKTFKVKDGDKNKNNELMSLSIDDDSLLEKYKTILDLDWRLEKILIECFCCLWW